MLLAAKTWSDGFLANYEAESARAWNRRERRREAARQHAANFVLPLEPCGSHGGMKPLAGALARRRAGEVRATGRDRLANGWRWRGGLLDGNPAYYLPACTYRGLVSELHAMLRLFVTYTPRASRLRSGSGPGKGSPADSKLIDLDAPRVGTTPEMRGALRVRLRGTRPGGFPALREAFAGLGLPLPNIVVGHEDEVGQLHDPHLLWLLADPVCFTPRGRKAHKRFWRRTLAALTAALLPFGADPAGAREAEALWVRNPLCPGWAREVWAEKPYSLGEDTRPNAAGHTALAPCLDLRGAWTRLREAEGRALARPRCATPEEVRERQAAGARATAAAKASGTLAAMVEAMRRLSTPGGQPTQAAVAEDIGKGRRTVQRHWHAALAALAEGAISSPPDREVPPSAAAATPGRAVPEVHGAPKQSAPSRRVAEGHGGPSGAAGAPSPPRPAAACQPAAPRPLPMPVPKATAGRRPVRGLPRSGRPSPRASDTRPTGLPALRPAPS